MAWAGSAMTLPALSISAVVIQQQNASPPMRKSGCITVRESEQRDLGHPYRKAWEAHSRQPHQFPQVVRQLARQSLQNSVCSGQHRGGLQFNILGPWLKSEAPALQAVLSGSVTRRTPPFHCGAGR